jgi:hypothetical protein
VRQERSSQKLGFGVPVRLTLQIPPSAERSWEAVAEDVLAGNNVREALVTIGPDDVRVAIEALPANA